ncbi:MAG: hypothetical protein ACRD1T_22045, partial [Acidimicrobiia bacterium]
ISQLKRSFGLGRTRLRRLPGAQVWVGLGIFAYNLQRMTVVTGNHRPGQWHLPPASSHQDFFRGK